ncbi:MAG: ABC transporter ATP-binding protein [Thermoprotei archaeon]|nr:MAG: ABC transporter ATP-binding protein [Thermoprotei archaeon]
MGMGGDEDDDGIKLYPSSGELPPPLRELLEEGEEVVAVARSDLVGDEYGEKHVVLTNKRLLVLNERLEYEVPLSKITMASLRSYINTCVMALDTDEGPKSVVVFTKARLKAFENLVSLINNLVVGKIPYSLLKRQLLKRVKAEAERKSSKAVLLRLLGLLKPIAPLLAATIVVAVAMRLVNLIPPYLMKILVDEVLTTRAHVEKLAQIALSLLAVNLVNTALGTLNGYLSTKLNVAVANRLRYKVFSKLQELSLSHYDRFTSGSLFSRVIDDVNRIQWFMTGSFNMIFINAAMIAFIGATLVTLNPWLTAIALLPIPIAILGSAIYRRLAARYYHRLWRRWSRIVSIVSDAINAAILVKSFGKEPTFREKFSESLEEYERAQMDVFKFEQEIWPAVGLAFTASNILVWWMGGLQVLSGAMSLGSLMAFTSYMWMFYTPVFSLLENVKSLQRAAVAANRIFEVLDLEPEVEERPHARDLELGGEVECENLWFTYDGVHYALKGVNLRIRAGERIGLVGPSGSGKTTLVKLLLHLYEPQVGTIRYDGVDVREIKSSSLKRQVAIVLQNPILLDTTIAENIMLGREDASPEEVIAAAKAARAHSFIMRLPEAYDTEVGSRGSRLSGGERARVALAAALLKNPKILILDEPTAALDALTEEEVTEELERLTKGRTTIIIAHRLSTLRFVDRVVVMDEGKIVEEGAHEELLRRGGLYKKLWEAQLKGLTRMSAAAVSEGYAR